MRDDITKSQYETKAEFDKRVEVAETKRFPPLKEGVAYPFVLSSLSVGYDAETGLANVGYSCGEHGLLGWPDKVRERFPRDQYWVCRIAFALDGDEEVYLAVSAESATSARLQSSKRDPFVAFEHELKWPLDQARIFGANNALGLALFVRIRPDSALLLYSEEYDSGTHEKPARSTRKGYSIVGTLDELVYFTSATGTVLERVKLGAPRT